MLDPWLRAVDAVCFTTLVHRAPVSSRGTHHLHLALR